MDTNLESCCRKTRKLDSRLVSTSSQQLIEDIHNITSTRVDVEQLRVPIGSEQDPFSARPTTIQATRPIPGHRLSLTRLKNAIITQRHNNRSHRVHSRVRSARS